ncbi:uncharacterized protein CYP2J40 [Taeniopygia guttata]|uniref:uncharacterized protein CYP2J40 n=1 Tax=Taeniopygia guttata TaxID=59729 RepID=UPI003BB86105
MELQFWPDLVSVLKKMNSWMVLVVLVILILIIDLVRKRRPRNFPPGPQLFPLVGTVVDFKQPLHLALQKLTGQYGNIFSVQFGSLTFVVVSGYQMVREALVHQAETFADRPNIPLLQEIFRGFGLISSNGHIWRQQRKFASATLKSLAVNFEEKVQEESRYLVETIEEEKGQPFDPHYKINSAVSNIICSITFGNRFDYHDNRFQELLHSLAETLLLIGSFWGQLYNAFPLIMRWFPGPFRKIFRHWEKLQYFVKEVIAKHKEDLDQSEAGDYIDCYLKEIEKFKGDTSSYFHEENLLCCTLDLFLTGTETTATAIRWALLYMAAYPHIQEKVQQEIDAVVGQCRQPSMAEKEKMPYTSAVLSEVLRVGNMVPLGVPRMATSDTTLAGFHLPKGTTLMTSLTSVMFDKNVWETPDTFNPEHFLENGLYRRREAFLPFSAGKRACPGEQLARTELFIFFVALLQKFTFQAPAALSFAFTLSLTRCPKPFQLCAVPRHGHVPAEPHHPAMLNFLRDSISLQTFLIFLFIFLLIADYMKNRNPNNFPPTPFRLPFLGHVYLLDFKDPAVTARKLSKRYGDIFGIHMGSMKFVMVNGMRLVKEVLVNQGDKFLDRPDIPIDEEIFSKIGLISSIGHLWKAQRRFTLSTLRNFGLGKRSLEERIQEECRYLLDVFGDEQGNPFNPQMKVTNAVANVICSLIFGNRFEYHDEDFQRLLKLMYEMTVLHGAVTSQLYNSFPSIMKYLPGAHHTIFKNWRLLKKFMQEQINKHKEDWNPSESRDYIDSYLLEISKDHDSDTFQEEHLIACSLDLMFAGTETTSSTLRWALLFMATHPEIQARVQAEIDTVIGQARPPALEDRNNLHYTNAVIHEVQRKGNVIPFNVPRMASEDTYVDGYYIPKGTGIMANLSSLLLDENEWKTPNTFNPEHFLKDGKFWKNEHFLPFSLGKRACLGELLARSELFLFFTCLLQKFTFQAPPDSTLTLQPLIGITVAPQPYKICAVPR